MGKSERKTSVYKKEEGGGYISIKKPQKKYPRFGLYQKVNTNYKYIYPDQLESINEQFQNETLTFEEALKQVKALKVLLYKQRDVHTPQLVFNKPNLTLVNHYWSKEYEDRELIDEQSMKSDLIRSVGSLGMLSILVASKQEMQKAVNAHYKSYSNLQRRAVTRLNQLLKFAGRNIELKKAREEFKEVSHLTLEDFTKVASKIPDEDFKTLCWVAITTGLRLGEIFAINQASIRDSYILVKSQIDAKGTSRQTKNRKIRKAFTLPEGRIWIEKWVNIDEKAKASIRGANHARRLRQACIKIFPNDETRQIKVHDLRHSYAIHVLGKGATLAHVAQSLGNSQLVCEKYYTGFQLTETSIETMKSLF